MKEITLHPHIEDYERCVEKILSVGTTGFVILFNFQTRIWTNFLPEYLDARVPERWKKKYDGRKYVLFDPVIRWAWKQDTDADVRWSEITEVDPVGVMRDARKEGLVYGVSFLRKYAGKTNLMSISRNDRDITDQELSEISELFTSMVSQVPGPEGVSVIALKVMQDQADGFSFEETASKHGISVSSAKQHIAAARQQMGCKTNTHATVTAKRKGWIH